MGVGSGTCLSRNGPVSLWCSVCLVLEKIVRVQIMSIFTYHHHHRIIVLLLLGLVGTSKVTRRSIDSDSAILWYTFQRYDNVTYVRYVQIFIHVMGLSAVCIRYIFYTHQSCGGYIIYRSSRIKTVFNPTKNEFKLKNPPPSLNTNYCTYKATSPIEGLQPHVNKTPRLIPEYQRQHPVNRIYIYK